jgi:hypothetical protein
MLCVFFGTSFHRITPLVESTAGTVAGCVRRSVGDASPASGVSATRSRRIAFSIPWWLRSWKRFSPINESGNTKFSNSFEMSFALHWIVLFWLAVSPVSDAVPGAWIELLVSLASGVDSAGAAVEESWRTRRAP